MSGSSPARKPFIGSGSGALFALLALVVLAPTSGAQTPHVPGYAYLSPMPGARMVSPSNNVIVRSETAVNAATMRPGDLSVTGSVSGAHAGALVLSDDGKTMVFTPDEPFTLGEHVVVKYRGAVQMARGRSLPPLTFEFTVTTTDPNGRRPDPLQPMYEEMPGLREAVEAAPESPLPRSDAATVCGLPADYPDIQVTMSYHPAPGEVFIAPFGQPGGRGHLVVLDPNGEPVFYRSTPRLAYDFKMQPNGLLTYFTVPNVYYGLDSTCTIVDTFSTGNGYVPDGHDLQLLPDGHFLIMAYDYQYVDMSLVVPGGDPDAEVIGLIVQELDAAKNVVFQWRSWDHFQITDMIECGQRLTNPVVDYVHGNALELDTDGNILLSSRHLSEITKIDRMTGDVIWRMGLRAKNNEFTFVKDDEGFSFQHDIRRLPNGHITIFDNDNCSYSPTPRSRALEYELDETNKVAALVWEYRNTPDVDAPAMGNVQRLPDGGTMIGWGVTFTDPKLTEIHADGSKALEVGFNDPNLWSYRSFKYPWGTTRFRVDQDTLDYQQVRLGEPVTKPLTISNDSGADLEITCFVITDPNVTVPEPTPFTIPAGGSTVVHVRYDPQVDGILDGTLYVRSSTSNDMVAQSVVLKGHGLATLPGTSPAGAIALALALLSCAVWAIRWRRGREETATAVVQRSPHRPARS